MKIKLTHKNNVWYCINPANNMIGRGESADDAYADMLQMSKDLIIADEYDDLILYQHNEHKLC